MGSLRVATWNVHGFSDANGRSTSRAIIAVCESLRCDAIALQEVPAGSGTLARAADALGMHAALAPASFLGNALLSRAKPAAFEVVPLALDGCEPRSAFVASLPWPGGTFTFAGTHLDPHDEALRRRQLEPVLARLGAHPGGGRELVLLAGDLNALCLADYDASALERLRLVRARNRREPPLGELTASLTSARFLDLWRRARETGPEPNPDPYPERAHDFGAVATCWAGTRIDYLFAEGAFDAHARLVSCERVPSDASDHVPVVAEIAPRRPEAAG